MLNFLSGDRALQFIQNDRARTIIVHRDSIVEIGVQISLASSRSNVTRIRIVFSIKKKSGCKFVDHLTISGAERI